jgi:uncharacterized protein YndB with AHSA1/START domain
MSRNRIEIAAPPEAVFSVLDDACAYPRWVVAARRVRYVDTDWPAVGSAFHHALGVPGAELHDSSEIVDRDAPHHIVLQVRFRPTGTARVQIDVDKCDNGSVVTMTETPVSGPVSRLPGLISEPLLRARNAWSLHRLRHEVERQFPSGPSTCDCQRRGGAR